eukprot:511157-Rhodomonas_salina.1
MPYSPPLSSYAWPCYSRLLSPYAARPITLRSLVYHPTLLDTPAIPLRSRPLSPHAITLRARSHVTPDAAIPLRVGPVLTLRPAYAVPDTCPIGSYARSAKRPSLTPGTAPGAAGQINGDCRLRIDSCALKSAEAVRRSARGDLKVAKAAVRVRCVVKSVCEAPVGVWY